MNAIAGSAGVAAIGMSTNHSLGIAATDSESQSRGDPTVYRELTPRALVALGNVCAYNPTHA